MSDAYDGVRSGGDATALLAGLPGALNDVVAQWVATQPDHPAVVDETGAWSYASLGRAVAAASSLLHEAGLRAGDRLLVLGENCRAMVALILAASALRAVAVPLNPKLSAQEIDAIRAHADARLAAYCIASGAGTRAHAERHGAVEHEHSEVGGFALAASGTDPVPSAADVALMIYTSGSSGQPKGVELTHRNLLFMAAASGAIRRLTPVDRLYVVLPLSHIVALSVLMLGGLMHGATLQIAARFTPRGLRDALAQDGVTILLATPALITLLVEHGRLLPPLQAPRLRIVSVSGAPLDGTTKTAAEAFFRLPLHHGYGITECAPTIAQMRLEDPRADLSVGRLLPGVTARLIRPDGTPAAPGESGELHVRGPNVMRGYFRAPAETAASVDAEGWFNTGDLARFEGENLFIVGRTKELVIRFGFNVYPAEVEAAISAHPAVRACAVIGHATGREEELLAFVEPADGVTSGAAELMRHAAARLAPYKRPSQILFMDNIPRTTSGKLHKQALRTWADSNLPSVTGPSMRTAST